MTTPPITALDREAALARLEEAAYRAGYEDARDAGPDDDVDDLHALFAIGMEGARLLGDADDALLQDYRRLAAERATSPAGDAGEVERLRAALREIVELSGTLRDPIPRCSRVHAYALAALLPQAGDADVVGEPGA